MVAWWWLLFKAITSGSVSWLCHAKYPLPLAQHQHNTTHPSMQNLFQFLKTCSFSNFKFSCQTLSPSSPPPPYSSFYCLLRSRSNKKLLWRKRGWRGLASGKGWVGWRLCITGTCDSNVCLHLLSIHLQLVVASNNRSIGKNNTLKDVKMVLKPSLINPFWFRSGLICVRTA